MRLLPPLLACVLSLAATATAAEAPHPVLLQPDRVWTGDGDAAHAGWLVLVRNGTIEAVGDPAAVHAPADARRVVLPGTTLAPGLIDLHSHLFLHPYNETPWNDQVLKEPEPYRTLEAAQHARDTLLAGFTTLRDLGTEGAGFADVSVKHAIEDGLIPGPRLFVATRAIVATASYGPGPRGFRPDLDLPGGAQDVSGADEAIRAVREQAGRGADWIKVYTDYRIGTDGSTEPTFTAGELHALVEAAHASGRPVSAHAQGDTG
ncbi:MAG TPA: amidohydrolase family protein, partial [Xanthomonadaceae bacterium]|nr:amidohydrolase family protein [Xanthomonadaceae bacterium]